MMYTLRLVVCSLLLGVSLYCDNTTAQQIGTATELLPPPQQMQPPLPVPDAAFNQLPVAPTMSPATLPLTVRLKDIVTVEGHRSNVLTGWGLVTGLDGTGGQSIQTQQVARNVFRRNGMMFDGEVATQSLSFVSVSAEIPPFKRVGEKVSVRVSVADDATSLRGGQLLVTPLYGHDGQIYAVADGEVVIGGFSASGQAAKVQKNHVTAGRATAQIEKEICFDEVFPSPVIRLLLRKKDYKTASRVAGEINNYFPSHARSVDAGTIEVLIPESFAQSKNDFIAMLGDLRVTPDIPAKVVINEKTGTIVIGHNVRLSKLVFAYGNLVITTNEAPLVAQPNPLAQGRTTVVPRTGLVATEFSGPFNVLNDGITVADLASALNSLGVTPQDLIAIFQSIDASHGLHAELVIQ